MTLTTCAIYQHVMPIQETVFIKTNPVHFLIFVKLDHVAQEPEIAHISPNNALTMPLAVVIHKFAIYPLETAFVNYTQGLVHLLQMHQQILLEYQHLHQLPILVIVTMIFVLIKIVLILLQELAQLISL